MIQRPAYCPSKASPTAVCPQGKAAPLVSEVSIVEELPIEQRLLHRVRAGMVNPRSLSLEITRDEARKLVKSLYDEANTQYIEVLHQQNGEFSAMREEFSGNQVQALDLIAELRAALRSGDYESVISQLDAEAFGVPLHITEDISSGRTRIRRKN